MSYEKVLGSQFVFVSTDQQYIEKKLAATFAVIATSPDMSSRYTTIHNSLPNSGLQVFEKTVFKTACK